MIDVLTLCESDASLLAENSPKIVCRPGSGPPLYLLTGLRGKGGGEGKEGKEMMKGRGKKDD